MCIICARVSECACVYVWRSQERETENWKFDFSMYHHTVVDWSFANALLVEMCTRLCLTYLAIVSAIHNRLVIWYLCICVFPVAETKKFHLSSLGLIFDFFYRL